MHADLVQQKLKTALKHLLKKQGSTYGDLARVWECSLPTVKRQLGPEELPLSRLLSLLDWLGLTLADLHKLAASEEIERPKYTVKQNEFLARNAREFAFLTKLYQNQTPEQIAAAYDLAPAVVDKILIQLEKYGLVRTGRNGVKPVHEQFPSLEGALGRAHANTVIERIAQFQRRRVDVSLTRQAQGQSPDKGGIQCNYAVATQATYEEFLAKQERLMEEFGATAKIEEKTLPKSKLKTAVFTSSAFLCDSGERDLAIVTDLMDEGLRAKIDAPPITLSKGR